MSCPVKHSFTGIILEISLTNRQRNLDIVSENKLNTLNQAECTETSGLNMKKWFKINSFDLKNVLR